MNIPTNGDINAMKRLNAIMNGETPEPEAPKLNPDGTVDNNVPFVVSTGPTQKDVKDMAKLMEVMGGQVNKVAKSSNPSPVLKEAMATKQTDKGIVIGDWAMERVQMEGIVSKPDTFHKIYNSYGGESFEEMIFIPEGAIGIVKMLNSGLLMNDAKITKIFELDAKYQRLRVKALQEKYQWHKAQGTDTEWKQELFEAKFDAAKANALYVAERVKNLALSYSNTL